jgi:hypothetical protein
MFDSCSRYIKIAGLFFLSIVAGNMFGAKASSGTVKEETDRKHTTIYIKQNNKNYINIKSNSIKIVTDLDINVDIVGGGDLLLASKKKSKLNAHDCSIDRITIAEGTEITLLSDLEIVKQIDVKEGFLLLSGFDLILHNDAFKAGIDFNHIINNGQGAIVLRKIPPSSHITPPTLSTNITTSKYLTNAISIAKIKCNEHVIFQVFDDTYISKTFLEIIPPPPKSY